MSEPSVHFWKASDGVELAYQELGEGRPVVLLHGLFSDAVMNWIKFGHAARLAADGFRVIMPDLRGHGLSGRPHEPEHYPRGILARDLRELIGDYHRAVADTVGRLDGFVAKYMGDGVLIYFGYPQAHEDDAERAVRAGLDLIDAVGSLDIKSVKLQGRFGIATGLVVVGDLIGEGSAKEQSVVGETPNLAARMQTLAEPDTVVIARDIATTGNTSAASIPLATHRLLEEHPELSGGLSLQIGFGAGLVFGAQVVVLP